MVAPVAGKREDAAFRDCTSHRQYREARPGKEGGRVIRSAGKCTYRQPGQSPITPAPMRAGVLPAIDASTGGSEHVRRIRGVGCDRQVVNFPAEDTYGVSDLRIVPAHRRPIGSAICSEIGARVGGTGCQDEAVGGEGGGEAQGVPAGGGQLDFRGRPGNAVIVREVNLSIVAVGGDEGLVVGVVRRDGKGAEVATQAGGVPRCAAVGGFVQSLTLCQGEEGLVGDVSRRKGQLAHVVYEQPTADRREVRAAIGGAVDVRPG